jgi:signal peptidase II
MNEGSMNDGTKRYLWLVAVLAIAGFAADQASKYIIFASMRPERYPLESTSQVIDGYFKLRVGYTHVKDDGEGNLSFLRTVSSDHLPHVNKGALFGIGNPTHEEEEAGLLRSVLKPLEDSDGGLNTFFTIISGLAAVFIVLWARRPAIAHDRFVCLALGLILAGTLGNLYDRVIFSGVRDFLYFYYVGSDSLLHSWPDFNIADCCLVCGAFTLLAHSFLVKEKKDEPAKVDAAATQTAAPMQATTPAAGT